MTQKAVVSDIHSLSAHDGPGMRTTIFFKGCSLKCLWCHNPETIKPQPEIRWDNTKCLGCRICEEVCPMTAISFAEDDHYIINKEKCIACGICAEVCPSQALEIVGKEYTVEELFQRILKDERFIKSGGGGVTFSGGEPLLNTPFLKELSEKLKKHNFHLTLDTGGNVNPDYFEEILPYIDLILYDLKEIDNRRHKEFTGSNNEKIFNNLFHIRDIIKKQRLKTRIWIRTPLIPGMTDTEDNISGIGDLLSLEFADVIDKWELLGFNNMCSDKYRKLGFDWALGKVELLSLPKADNLLHTARKAAAGIGKVVFTGLTYKGEGGENASS